MAGKNTTISGAVRAEDFYKLSIILADSNTGLTMSKYIDFSVQVALALGADGITRIRKVGPEAVAEALKTSLE